MNHLLAGTVAAAAGVAAIAAARPGGRRSATPEARQGSEWTWHGAVAAGKTLEIRGINGSIDAEPASGSEVVVTATKTADHSDPAEVKIAVVQTAGNVTICAVYPGSSNRCGSGDDYRMNTRNNDVQVRFHAQVPAGVAFTARNVNGAVAAAGLAGPVDVGTVNGAVRVETSAGEARGHTVNGSVTATVRGGGSNPLSFETVNGGVTVSLPRDLNADLDAATVNGSIETDFPVTVTGRLGRHHLKGAIGRGGRPLKIATVNGTVRLRAL